MAERNKHGLTRTIPRRIKQEVRQRCGFGCVKCGASLYDYEHFDPEFKDASEHNPEGMTLLCMQCNQKKRRGALSVETVSKANQNPKCLQQGFSSEIFDFDCVEMEVAFAGVTFKNCRHLIQVKGIPILSINSPEHEGEPFGLSGRFSDNTGVVTLKIEDNVWSVGADNWDVECVGPRIIIRNEPKKIVLKLKSEPPTKLIVERLDMEFEGVCLRGKDDVLKTSFNGIDWYTWQGCEVDGGNVGIAL